MTKRPGLRRKQKKNPRLALTLVIIVLVSLITGWQLFDMQSVVQRIRNVFSTADDVPVSEGIVRGTLYDRNYKEMAVSLERVSVYARSREMQSVDAAVKELAPALDVDAEQLAEKLRGEALRIWLVRNINQEQEDAVRRLELPGIYLHKEYSRYYPLKKVAAHFVGFVQDDIGLAGIEYYYDRLVQKMLAKEDSSGYRGGAGQHLLLTVDLKIQTIFEQFVEDLAIERPGYTIGAYAMDAGTGALIASVQNPSFDPNTYRIYSQDILGSILGKPMLLPAVFRRILRDSAAIQNQYESRGQVHPWSISAQELSLGGELRLWDRLGLGDDDPPDFRNSVSQAGDGPNYFLVQGQTENDFGTVSDSMSPLGLLASFSSLLNGGKKVEPYAVQTVVAATSGHEFELHLDSEIGAAKEVVHEKVSREISRLMASLSTPNELGGGTIHGTVQASISNSEGFGYLGNELFFTAVPFDHAQLAVLITIQGGNRITPGKGQVKLSDPGGELAEQLPRIAVLQQVGKSIVDIAEPGAGENGNYPIHLDRLREAVRNSLGENQVDDADTGKMPDLVGLSLRKSLRLLQSKRCEIRVHGTGRVVAQEPSPGTPFAGVKECVIRLQQQEEVSLETLEEKLSDKK
jgi:cell division protein FtsI (penicillin-binding protein 3)